MSGFGRILGDLNRVGVRYVLIGGIERDLVDLHDLEAAHGELPDSRIGSD